MCHSISQNKSIHRIFRTPGPVSFLCSEMNRYQSSRWIFAAKHLGNTSFNIHWWVFIQVHRPRRFITFDPVDEGIWVHVPSKKYYNRRVFRSGWRYKTLTTLPMFSSYWHKQIKLKRLRIVFKRQQSSTKQRLEPCLYSDSIHLFVLFIFLYQPDFLYRQTTNKIPFLYFRLETQSGLIITAPSMLCHL